MAGYLEGSTSFLGQWERALTGGRFYFGGALLGLVVAACTLRGNEVTARRVGVG